MSAISTRSTTCGAPLRLYQVTPGDAEGLGAALDAISIDGGSLPIALGLLIMMYPVQAKVRYDRLDAVTSRPLDVARIALPLLMYFAVMGRLLRPGQGHRAELRAHHDPGVHRRGGDRTGTGGSRRWRGSPATAQGQRDEDQADQEGHLDQRPRHRVRA